jgi:uncharacterized membrane protein (UPF0127 family)
MTFIVNKTRKKTLAKDGSILRSMWRMALGAMFRGLQGKALVFVWSRSETIALTNWFVPESIDILWLDERCIVVELHERFPSWAFHTANKMPARYVIELPAGTIAASKTRVGDSITVRGL